MEVDLMANRIDDPGTGEDCALRLHAVQPEALPPCMYCKRATGPECECQGASISRYYERKDAARRAARAAIDLARERGAGPATMRELQDNYDRVANTGD